MCLELTVGGTEYGEKNGIFDPSREEMETAVLEIQRRVDNSGFDIDELTLRAWRGTEFRMSEGGRRDLEKEWEELCIPEGVFVNAVVSADFIESLGFGTEDEDWLGSVILGIDGEEFVVETATVADTQFGIEINDPKRILKVEELTMLADDLMKRVESRLDVNQIGTVWVRQGEFDEYTGKTEQVK